MLEPYIIQATLDDLSVYNYNHHHDHDRSDNNNINFIHDHDPDPDHGKGHSYPVYILSGIHSLIRHSLESHALSDNINSCAATNPHSTHSFVKTGETALSLHYNPAQTDCGLPSRESRPTPSHTRQRSLTESVQAEIDHEMATFVTEAPGSPPGLTGSKSSKSSSFHSSSLSGTDGILSDITHFEEIGLEEAQPRSPISPRRSIHGPEKPLRPMLHMSATTTTGGPRGNAAVLTAMRDLTNIPSRLTPGGQLSPGKAHVPTHSLCLPNEGVMRKPYRNASTPSLAIRAMSNRNHSRSPSPGSTSTTSKQSITPKPSPRLVPVPFSPKQAPIRRGSWQPSRKSVKELEAEYNDEDDDLPEDASLWNVPLSPRPPSERSPKIGPVSPKCSPRVSPERPSPLRASISAPLTDLSPNVTAGTYSAESAISPNLSSPLSPRWKPKTTRVASTGTLPDHFGYQPSRSKSWSAVLSELSEEAKALTESLENHALVTERKQEDAVQNGREIRRNGTEKLSRSKTSTIELPPLRRNNVMIDPLPISKEKEKVLTRTRPSWLPPKSQKEEKKHLKEYQRMMELSQEAERKKAAQVADLQCAKDDTKKTLLRIWEEHVLPNWDQVIREPRTRELWWRGVAPKSRAQVWPKVVGNELSLTEMSYSKALQRAKEIEKQIATGSEIEQHRKEKLWFDAIQRDVKVALPDLKIFQPGGPLHDSLIDVLMAYSMYRSDVGYSHGTHLIAALLLLNLPSPLITFTTLSNLLNRPLPLAFLTGDPAATHRTYSLTMSLLASKYPRLHSHLFGETSASKPPPIESTLPAANSYPPSETPQNTVSSSLGLAPALVLEPLYRTLFLGPGGGLGVDIATRVWDVILFDGDIAIIRTAVAILGSLEGKLYGDRNSVLSVLGWSGGGGWESSLGGEDVFMERVREVGKDDRRQ